MTHSSQAPAPTAEAKGPGTGNAGWLARYTDAVMNTFGTPGRVLVRGRGAHVWDADGQEYIDLLAGIAVNCLGHAHPAIIRAVTEQLSELGHVSNFFTTPAQVGLAEELVRLTFPDRPAQDSRVFLANSGTEANEAAFKIARRHGGSRRPRVLALQDAFHGRTMGALALTHKAAYREPFEPLPGGVEFVPAGDIEALRTALGPDVAALVVEPIQGEAGVRELPAGYLGAARELTEAAGALLIIDEVQTGMGRTGAWMAHHLLAPGVVPDVVTLAKGLGGGIPIGAVVATGQAAALLEPGQHGTTFGGNPVACAAALAVIGTIRSQSLLERVQQLGSAWSRELAAVDGVDQVRGRGLLLGVGLEDGLPPAAEIAASLAARELTEAAGALLIIDEVQTGMGRTGAWMAHHLLAPGIVPDVVTLAKGLGGGVPIGAVVASGQAAALLEPGQHGTTFGGNPVACAAALAVIGTIRSQSLLERVQQLGSAWSRELAVVDGVNQVRGRGLLLGVGLDDGLPPAAEIAAALAARGFIVNAPRPDTIRLAPPFILSDDDARAFTTTLSEVLARALSEKAGS